MNGFKELALVQQLTNLTDHTHSHTGVTNVTEYWKIRTGCELDYPPQRKTHY
jgi:hypothetical protein